MNIFEECGDTGKVRYTYIYHDPALCLHQSEASSVQNIHVCLLACVYKKQNKTKKKGQKQNKKTTTTK